MQGAVDAVPHPDPAAVRLDVHDIAARESLRILTQSAQIQGSAP